MKKSMILASAATGFLVLAGAAALSAAGQEDDPAIYAQPVSGVSEAALAREVDTLFDDDTHAETRALVIMRGGELVYERYAPGYDRDTRFISWSMAKSVTSVLVGLMVSDGRLALDSPAPVPEWQQPGDPRGAITLRQLLHMASGLDHTEAGSPPYESDEVRMLFLDGRDDMAGYAKSRQLEAEPGSKFEYSTNTSVILADIVARQLTSSNDPEIRRRAMTQFMQGRLFEPLGLSSMTPEFDASGTMIGGSIIQANARDWARFGEFLRNRGSVDGNQIVPRSWFDFMLAPSPTDPAYAGHIWLNRPRPEGRNPVLFPGNGPASIFACLGHLGQYVIVSPEQRLVVVRLGKTQDDVLAPVTEQLGRIVALFPRG
ncbi:MAG: serine hydrolase [Blastomonas sp.]